MTIRDMGAFERSMWDWGVLKGCFGDTRISPTDVDGLVERKNHFLLLEAKRPGVTVPLAQQIIFERLYGTGFFTIIVVWGEPGKTEKLRIMDAKGIREKAPATNDDLRIEVSAWFTMANGR